MGAFFVEWTTWRTFNPVGDKKRSEKKRERSPLPSPPLVLSRPDFVSHEERSSCFWVCACESEDETFERKGIRRERGLLWHSLWHKPALEMQWDHLLPDVGRRRARSFNFIQVSVSLQPLTTLLSTTKDRSEQINGGLIQCLLFTDAIFNSAFANILLLFYSSTQENRDKEWVVSHQILTHRHARCIVINLLRQASYIWIKM